MYDYEITRERAIANALYSLCNEGATFDYSFNRPKSGYVVGGVKTLTWKTTPEVDVNEMIPVIREFADMPGYVFGIWKDPETKVYSFDVGTVEDNLDDALVLATERQERAILDLSKGEVITLWSDGPLKA